MSRVLHLLAERPDVQDKLRNELDQRVLKIETYLARLRNGIVGVSVSFRWRSGYSLLYQVSPLVNSALTKVTDEIS